MEFHYPTDIFEGNPYPGIQVRFALSNGIKSKPYNALIDSGADCCFIDEYLAEDLGLPLGAPFEVTTAGGIVKGRATTATIAFRGVQLRIHAVALSDQVHGLILGRDGFFDKFVIQIDEQRQKVKLTKNRTFK